MEPRPEKGLYIYFHDEEPRTQAEHPAPPRGYCGILMNKTVEQDTDLVHRTEIHCDRPRLAPPGRLVDIGGVHNAEGLPPHPDPAPGRHHSCHGPG